MAKTKKGGGGAMMWQVEFKYVEGGGEWWRVVENGQVVAVVYSSCELHLHSFEFPTVYGLPQYQ